MSTGKIIITGTGRCGTTFLVRLFTWAGLKTGFPAEATLRSHGLELAAFSAYPGIDVMKSPRWVDIEDLDSLLELFRRKGERVETFIVPVRDAREVARSRLKRGWGTQGGPRWAQNSPTGHKTLRNIGERLLKEQGVPIAEISTERAWEEAEMSKDREQLTEFFDYTKSNSLPVLTLDFKKMTTDVKYLYQELKALMDQKNVTKPQFYKAYEKATSLWERGAF